MQKVNALQVFIKTAAVSGVAFFWVNFTVESLKMAWHIISSSPEDEKTLMRNSQDAAVFKDINFSFPEDEKTLMRNSQDAADFKAVCENCQEHFDDDEYHLIYGTKLCEACR